MAQGIVKHALLKNALVNKALVSKALVTNPLVNSALVKNALVKQSPPLSKPPWRQLHGSGAPPYNASFVRLLSFLQTTVSEKNNGRTIYKGGCFCKNYWVFCIFTRTEVFTKRVL